MKEKKIPNLFELAKKANVHKTTMYDFWKENEHTILFQFKKVCDGIDSTIDDGAKVLAVENDEARKALWKKLIYAEYGKFKNCAESIGTSRKYLTDVTDGVACNRILEVYKPIASALGLTLEQLATILDSER
ncbi:MAG TPA: hypothetical protein EYN91_24685 [Candidatus Melainabacteria bacterium]|nr:hypothetical protein [Candidatus Melainabacteria bacterium]HIN66988.1 hypothetical protein [Candidatus Obscuribacterales bacterium]